MFFMTLYRIPGILINCHVENDKVIYAQFCWKGKMQGLSAWVLENGTESYSSWGSLNKKLVYFPSAPHHWQPRALVAGEWWGWGVVPGESALLFYQPGSYRHEATMNIWWQCLPRIAHETQHYFPSICWEPVHSSMCIFLKMTTCKPHRGIWDCLFLVVPAGKVPRQSVQAVH